MIIYMKFKLNIRFVKKGVDINFINRISDIEFAVHQYNQYYQTRELKVVDVNPTSLITIVRIENEDVTDYSARLVSVFSKRLYHNRGWSVFTSREGNLFEADVEKLEHYTQDEWNNLLSIPLVLQKVGETHTGVIERPIMSDGEMMQALDAIIKIQDIGSPENIVDRQNALVEIKRIVSNLI